MTLKKYWILKLPEPLKTDLMRIITRGKEIYKERALEERGHELEDNQTFQVDASLDDEHGDLIFKLNATHKDGRRVTPPLDIISMLHVG